MGIDANAASYQIALIILVLLTGGFLKSFTTLQIFRIGLGFHGATVGVVVMIFSAVLALFVVDSVIPVGNLMTTLSAPEQRESMLEQRIVPFLEQRTDPERREEISRLQSELRDKFQAPVKSSAGMTESAPNPEQIGKQSGFYPVLVSFLLDELEGAFQLGVLFILPFVIIDLLVVHVMQLLQMTQLPALCFSLPMKLLLFLVVDGWGMLIQRLAGDYISG